MHRSIGSSVAILCFLFAALNFSGCAPEPVSEQSEHLFDLSSNGAINLENTDGIVSIFGWKQPRVRVESVRKAYTAERLHQIRIETKSRPESLSIRTIIPATTGVFADRSGTVGYTVTIPETSRLNLQLINGEVSLRDLRGGSAKVKLTNGRMTAVNCFAEVEGQATNGVMEILFDWWENLPANFHYTLEQGSIFARLPASAQFQIKAQTNDGWIHNAFGFAVPPRERRRQSLTAASAINPTASLGMQINRGNIDVDTIR